MKKFLCLFASFFVSAIMFAEQVTEQQAFHKAQQFMKGKKLSVVNTKSFSRGSSRNEEAFYIFNAENKGGFVIVSGDDRTDDILGYSDSGEIDLEKMPTNLRYWLQEYQNQIETVRTLNYDGSLKKTNIQRKEVPYLIQTKWDQAEPYNLMCPEIDGELPITGCVATAMAQVMYYHKWPQQPCAAMPSYTKSHLVPALPSTTFKWDKMQLTYDGSDRGESADAVAELMRYCGQAVEMNYGIDGSEANVFPSTMINFFGYSKNCKWIERGNYTSEKWEEMIYDEIYNGRPVLYEGSSPSVGHQFICDGYDGNGLFHINWGWSGSSDGYFLLSLLNPGEIGLGGGMSYDGYTYSQGAIIGLCPENGDPVIPYVHNYMWSELSQTEFNRTSDTEDFKEVELPGLIDINNESGNSAFAFDYGWALYKDNQLLEVLGYKTGSHEPNTGIENIVSASFGKSLEDGVYQARQIFRPQGYDEWQTCYNAFRDYVVVTIKENSLTLRATDTNIYPLTADITVNSVSYSGKQEIGRPMEVTVNLTNNGDTNQEMVCFWHGDNFITDVCGSIEPGQTGDVVLHFIPSVAGKLPIKITTDFAGERIVYEGSLTISEGEEHRLSGTASIKDIYNGRLYSTTFSITANIRNDGDKTFDDDIVLDLHRLNKIDDFGGKTFAVSTQAVKIEPNETKEITFTIPNLIPGDLYYWFDVSYFAKGQSTVVEGIDYLEVTVVDKSRCDINGDGVLDENDLRDLADYITGNNPDNFNEEAADLNGDDMVNVADIVILNNLLGNL